MPAPVPPSPTRRRAAARVLVALAALAATCTLVVGSSGAAAAPAVASRPLAAGEAHTCAADLKGALRCWGAGTAGQLASGELEDRRTPGDAQGIDAPVRAVAGGAQHTCALSPDGQARCWGAGRRGQLGDGGATDATVPSKVKVEAPFSALDAGGDATCAVDDEGRVWCWGAGDLGQLGDGGGEDRPVPAPVEGIEGAAAVTVGDAHACAASGKGEVRCWGLGAEGQVGPDAEKVARPTVVPGLPEGIVQVEAGGHHTCARTGEGEVWCWGAGERGQLGGAAERGVPVRVRLDGRAVALAAGGEHTCAIDGDGALWCWGADDRGQLGVGGKEDRVEPARVEGVKGRAASVAAGGAHTCAGTVDGAVWCWGADGRGQLGDGGKEDARLPLLVDGAGVPTSFDPPTIEADRSPAPNAAGWSNEPVTVTFSCRSEALERCTDATTITTDGTDHAVTGFAEDLLGRRASVTVGAINVDRVAPSIGGSPTTVPGPSGWYRGPVIVRWSCDDDRSGIAPGACPADTVLNSEGGAVTTSASVADLAGNLGTGGSQIVRIDRTAPTTSVTPPPAWSTGEVTLELQSTDALSGIARTRFQVDGGPTVDGNRPVVRGDGSHEVTYWSEDRAGNVEAPSTVRVAIDASAPTIEAELQPAPNGAGWNRAPVQVSFRCGDATSGVASCTGDRQVTTDGEQVVQGVAVDEAGNRADGAATVRLDQQAPTVRSVIPAGNAAGWSNAPVQVSYACTDAGGSGVAACPAPTVFAGEGANQAVGASGRDLAGNEASSDGTVSIDLTPPTISGATVGAPNTSGGFTGSVTVRWTCDDAVSGIASCPAPQTVTSLGTTTVSASATDRAGNTATAEVVVRIDRDTSNDPGVVRGRVTDAATGRPVAGAVVTVRRLVSSAVVAQTTSGSDGRYLFPAVDDGRYQVAVANNGVHLPAFHPGVATAATGTVLAVARGQVVVADVALEPGHVLRGRLTAPDGSPIGGADIRVEGGGVAYRGVTAADGTYAVTGMVGGNRTVTFIAYGYKTASAPASIPAVGRLDRALAVAPATAGLRGTITSTVPGGPLSGAVVRLWPKGGTTFGISTTSGRDGRYTVPGVPAEDYEIDTYRSGYLSRWFPESAGRSGAATVAFAAGCPAPAAGSWGDPCARVIDVLMR